ncbi:CRISPR-associated endonuclease Cas1 1 (fragment) [Candidatus Desulfosporosinus infrequens]|uniref:CRISPR-associated endonuclease Cas1 1 n=1 Tax=Candidatus Desulfosporosinus infrequens TaxID=2043169 RepID=A0A2U3LB12_9FIRM
MGKIYNARWVVERATRDYSARLDVDKLKGVCKTLVNSLKLVESCQDLEQLRGFEGEAAAQYFKVFDDLILQQKEHFYFRSRNKRPPLDNVNAMLSFVYTLLAHDVAAALETVGLDPYVGFLHRDRPGRVSLALDMMEELRAVYADRFVISLINKREINADGFTQKENGAVIMDDDTRKNILRAWQSKKQEIITHPFLQEKLEWGLVPYAQAMLLARFIRGDLDGYPTFMWK